MDLDFSFTLRTSVRSTVKQNPKTKPTTGRDKKLHLSSTRRKHLQGLFVNNEIGRTESREDSQYNQHSRTSNNPTISSEEAKENLDPFCVVMNPECGDRIATSSRKSSSQNLNASSSASTKHDSSGEKDFVELAKVSLRKHQRSLYKRNIKDGKLFYKKTVITDLKEFINKSLLSNDNSDNRKTSVDVVNNGLRLSESLQVDRSALLVDADNHNEDDLFGASSSNLKLESQTSVHNINLKISFDRETNRVCQNLKRVDPVPVVGDDLLESDYNSLEKSLIVTSPSLLNSSLLGCRPLSNEKKRPRSDSFGDSNSSDCTRPLKRPTSNKSRHKSSLNDSGNSLLENLKAKVKLAINSSKSISADDSSLNGSDLLNSNSCNASGDVGPLKFSDKSRSNSSSDNSGSRFFENLKAKVKLAINSSKSICADDSSLNGSNLLNSNSCNASDDVGPLKFSDKSRSNSSSDNSKSRFFENQKAKVKLDINSRGSHCAGESNSNISFDDCRVTSSKESLYGSNGKTMAYTSKPDLALEGTCSTFNESKKSERCSRTKNHHKYDISDVTAADHGNLNGHSNFANNSLRNGATPNSKVGKLKNGVNHNNIEVESSFAEVEIKKPSVNLKEKTSSSYDSSYSDQNIIVLDSPISEPRLSRPSRRKSAKQFPRQNSNDICVIDESCNSNSLFDSNFEDDSKLSDEPCTKVSHPEDVSKHRIGRDFDRGKAVRKSSRNKIDFECNSKLCKEQSSNASEDATMCSKSKVFDNESPVETLSTNGIRSNGGILDRRKSSFNGAIDVPCDDIQVKTNTKLLENGKSEKLYSLPVTRRTLEKSKLNKPEVCKLDETRDASSEPVLKDCSLEKSVISFSKPQTLPLRRKSTRRSFILINNDSCASKDMFESDNEDEKSKNFDCAKTKVESISNKTKEFGGNVSFPSRRSRSCMNSRNIDESSASKDMFESDNENEKSKNFDCAKTEVESISNKTKEFGGNVSFPSRRSRSCMNSRNIDESSASKDMFECDNDNDRSKKGLNSYEQVIAMTVCDERTDFKERESFSSRKSRKSLDKSCKKDKNKVNYDDCAAAYVTPSLPKTKIMEITKWLTDSERSVRVGPKPAIVDPHVYGVVANSDSADECADKKDNLKTPKLKTVEDLPKENDAENGRTRTKSKKDRVRSTRKIKPEDKDAESSNQTKTTTSWDGKFADNSNGMQRPGTSVGLYTEPKKTKTKREGVAHPSFTEKKPAKSSMFSSSSSSEDLFGKFLDNEKKKRLSRLKRSERMRKLSVDRFICNDSSEEDEENSLAFYSNFIASEVKKDVECLSEGKWSNRSGESIRPRHAHPRRLSFESQDSGSDRATVANTVNTNKEFDLTGAVIKKPKKRTPDKISKRHVPIRISPKQFLGSNKKSVKKANSVKKTHVDKVLEQIKKINDNNLKRLEPTTPSAAEKGSAKKLKTPSTAVKSSGLTTPSHSRRREVEIFSKTPAKTPSFLSSLSVLPEDQRCHPDAVQYKKNFKKTKQELTKKLFSLFNREVFKNMLPEDLPLEWNGRLWSTSGYCFNKRTIKDGEVTRSARIQLSSKILDSPDRLRDTLIHEMCHAATWVLDGMKDAHGPTWKRWTLEAMRRFPELPRITVCHDYKINTKYSYKCIGCGYSIGRHSKSLDIEHKRCGYCYGKFELVVNVKERPDKKVSDKESDTATMSSATRAPRAATGFALFVKENYGKIKKENGNLVHKDVMKLLSGKFAEVKLTNEPNSALKPSKD